MDFVGRVDIVLQEDVSEPDSAGGVLRVEEGERFELLRALEEGHQLLEPRCKDDNDEVRGLVKAVDVLILFILRGRDKSDVDVVLDGVVLAVGALAGLVLADVEELLVGVDVEEVRLFARVTVLLAERVGPLVVFEELAVDGRLENDAGVLEFAGQAVTNSSCLHTLSNVPVRQVFVEQFIVLRVKTQVQEPALALPRFNDRSGHVVRVLYRCSKS